MSELVLTKFADTISNANTPGYAPPNTPIFYYAINREIDLANIKYLKNAIGFTLEEKKIYDIINWMEASGKNIVYMTNKKNEMVRINDILCKFILSYLNELCWKSIPAGGNNPNQAQLAASELSTIDVHDALNKIIPAFKGVGEIMSTMLEYKYPSKLVGASLSSAIKQVNLEVEEKTGNIIDKKTKKTKKNKK